MTLLTSCKNFSDPELNSELDYERWKKYFVIPYYSELESYPSSKNEVKIIRVSGRAALYYKILKFSSDYELVGTRIETIQNYDWPIEGKKPLNDMNENYWFRFAQEKGADLVIWEADNKFCLNEYKLDKQINCVVWDRNKDEYITYLFRKRNRTPKPSQE